ncbi:hypothetical protein D3C73_864250 [compost metagenome]
MSYNVHLTRAGSWTESESQPIALEEAKAYFAEQPDFEYSATFSVNGPFGTMTIGGEFFLWSPEEEELIPFKYTDGRITVSGADEYVIDRMKEIAAKLSAIVQGDEGEQY